MPTEPEQKNLLHRIGSGRFLSTATFFVVYAAVMVWLFRPAPSTGAARWIDAALLVLATVTTLVALMRHLPGQNVLGAAILIVVTSGTVTWINAQVGVPFGPVVYGTLGPRWFGVLPWAVPLFWVVAILNSRGVARLILRPWRKTRTYGFRLIGLTAMLATALDFAFEPYATQVKRYWFWEATRFPVTWHGATLVNFFSWLVVAVLTLAFITPILINKMQTFRRPPDLHPLMIWLATLVLAGTGSALAGLWSAVAVDAALAIVTAVFAIRGAKW